MRRALAYFYMVVVMMSGLAFERAFAQERAVTVEIETGFISVHLPLLRTKAFQYPDKTEVLALEFGGQLDGKTVGLFAQIIMDWEEQKAKDVPFSFWWSAGRLESAGENTDAFIRHLATLYGLKQLPARAKAVIPFKIVSIARKPSLSEPEFKLKGFIEGATEKDYAEFYFNVDLKRMIVTLSEKDPDYRQPIIRALSEQP